MLPTCEQNFITLILFSRSRDMIGAHKNLHGSHDLTTPISGVICHPWLGLPRISLTTSLSPPTTIKLWKATQNVENGMV